MSSASLESAPTEGPDSAPAAPVNENLNAKDVDEPVTSALSAAEVSRLKQVVWGRELKEETFDRWSQGFHFSDHEPVALVQEGGGPCAVITPIQGFIIKQLFSRCGDDATKSGNWRQCLSCNPYSLLIGALGEMLQLVAAPQRPVRVVHVVDTSLRFDEEEEEEKEHREKCDSTTETKNDEGASSSAAAAQRLSLSSSPRTSSSPPKRPRLSHDDFHASLAVTECASPRQLEHFLRQLHETKRSLSRRFAVLTFLYSSLLTKGLDEVLDEVEDPSEPLIDGLFGHGSQSLLNLCISGAAVSNVFDDERDLGGYMLKGVKKQAPLGFLSFLEHLRYCEVGWYLKNPASPIWVLGSETHFTLAFSPEKKLIVQDSPISNGRRAFKQLDPEGNGFISAGLLKDLLESLDLVCEPPEYVTIMKDKLDPEGLDIIVLNNFLSEFFGDADFDAANEIPKRFQFYHYNGLRKSGDPRLMFSEATAKIDEPSIIVTDATPIKMCLQTKWPTLEIDWNGNVPSLN